MHRQKELLEPVPGKETVHKDTTAKMKEDVT